MDRLDAAEAALVARAPQTADQFTVWIAPHLAVLRALAEREVGVDDADGVVQETLVRAWRRLSTFDPVRGTPRSWLIGVLLDRAQVRQFTVQATLWMRPSLCSCGGSLCTMSAGGE